MRRLSVFFVVLILLSMTGVAAQDDTSSVQQSGEFRVTEVFPASDSQQIAGDAVITVIFNRPVVPLVSVEDMADLPQPLTFSPTIDGHGEWLNTSIYTFRPDVSWAGGTEYTVTVAPGLQAVDGSVLSEGFSWHFTIAPPEVISIYPRDATGDVRLEPRIQITFNMPVNRASLEENFYIRPVGDTSGTVPGTFEWSDDVDGVGFEGMSFQPDELLEMDTLYTIGFPANRVLALSGTATVPETRWTISTVPYPALIGTDPFDGDVNISLYNGVTFYFASPMNKDTLRERITISPEPWREPSFYYRDYNNSMTAYFPAEPSTKYIINFASGAEDLYGHTIDSSRTFTFTTAAYSPSVNMRTPGTLGFYNAYRDETQLFVTHRNVSRLDLQLYDIPLRDFAFRFAGDSDLATIPRSSHLLRDWQITTDAPENATRFELLSLGTADGNDVAAVCPDSMPSKLRVGDTAVVVTEPDPLRARVSPPDGAQVTQLYRDYIVPIIGGPVCADNIVWWEIELQDMQNAWVAEGADGEYYLDLRVPGQTTEVTIPHDFANGEALSPGMYFLEVSSPETVRNGYRPRTHYLLVATANLIVKASMDEVTVWATDVQSGVPIPNAPITIYNNDFETIAGGVTNSDGILQVSIPTSTSLYDRYLVTLDDGVQFGLGLTTWADGISPWQFDQPSSYHHQDYQLYMYTDRPVYRPDQPVYFRGVLRSKDDVTYTPPDLRTVPVQIYDNHGEVVYERTLPVNEFGTFSDTFTLAEDAQLGSYRISVQLGDDNYPREGGSVNFSVAEYRLPEFQVAVTAAESAVVQGDTILVEIDSRYFFGGAVSNADVEYKVVTRPYYFDYDGPGGRFDFVDYDVDGGPGERYGLSDRLIADGTGTTDAQGILIVEIPADLEDAAQSQVFTIEAVVNDESNQVVAGRTQVTIHQGELYIGARPEKYVSMAEEEAGLEFIASDWDSNPIPGQEIDVEIVERRWSSVQEEDPDGRTVWTWEVEEISIDSGSVTTDTDGVANYTFTPPYGGVFKVIITSRDDAGNEVRSSTYMWVSSRRYVSWRQQNSNRIDLISDGDTYDIGDVAEILIASPFQGTTEALITVERAGIIKIEHVTMENNSYVYRVPITEDFAPNVFVTVMLVKGVDETNPVAGFRMGMIQLEVDNSHKEISIDITPNTDLAGPGDTVTYTVRTTNYAGNPISAEVGVGLTDLAALSIAEPNSGPLLDYFYGQQPLSVLTTTPLTFNTDQITETVLDTIKGGGGGGAEAGIFDIREEFVDTAHWEAHLITDVNGIATFEVVLPDNLTTWRLDARAVTMGDDGLTLVGQDTFDLISTKPLLIRPVTPRFFVIGDNVMLSAVINNNTGEAQSVQVFIEGSGYTVAGEITQTAIIPSGGRERIIWPVTIEAVENVDLTFFVMSEDGAYTDASKPPVGLGDDRLLPVYRYEAPEIVGTGGVLREGGSRTEAIMLPNGVTQGELTLNLDTSLAGTTLKGLDYLRNFPYQCAEQTVSRFLPNIMTYRALDSLDLTNPELEKNLRYQVEIGVQMLYSWQHVDGGWGWYLRGHSNSLVTAYALIGLSEAQNSGFAVDQGTIRRGQDFLRNNMIMPSINVDSWRLDRQAFVLYALARSGAPEVGRTVALYDHRERLSIYSKALLATTLDMVGDTGRVDTLISDILNRTITSANGMHWEESGRDYWNWNTNTRTTAMVLQMLIRFRPESDVIPNVVRWLMVARTADHWETTQETAWSVMALTDWMVASGELNPAFSYDVDFNGEQLTARDATPGTVTVTEILTVEVARMLQNEANLLTFSRTEGTGNLYYTAYMRNFLPVPEIEALDRGIIVSRHYTLLGDENRTPITEAQVGQIVQVRLTIIAPNSLHYVVIEDFLPAGAEGIDPGLTTNQQIGTRPGLESSNPLRWGWGWWWFSNIEFHDEKVVLNSSYLPAGTYEYIYTLRLGLEGTYNVIPPVGYEFYFPDVYGRGDGSTFTILPED